VGDGRILKQRSADLIRLASGSIPASILTLVVLWQLDLNGESSRSLVNLVLCFALFLTAASLIFRKAILERYRLLAPPTPPGRPCWWALRLACWSRLLRSGLAVGVTALRAPPQQRRCLSQLVLPSPGRAPDRC
jgi:hypothetical protein